MCEPLLLLEHGGFPGRIPQLESVRETGQQGLLRAGDTGEPCRADAGSGGTRFQPDVSGQVEQPSGEASVLAQRKAEPPDP